MPSFFNFQKFTGTNFIDIGLSARYLPERKLERESNVLPGEAGKMFTFRPLVFTKESTNEPPALSVICA